MTHKVKPIIHPMSLMTPKGGIITTTNQFPTFQSRKHKSQSKIKEIALLSNVEDTFVTTKNKQKPLMSHDSYLREMIFPH